MISKECFAGSMGGLGDKVCYLFVIADCDWSSRTWCHCTFTVNALDLPECKYCLQYHHHHHHRATGGTTMSMTTLLGIQWRSAVVCSAGLPCDLSPLSHRQPPQHARMVITANSTHLWSQQHFDCHHHRDTNSTADGMTTTTVATIMPPGVTTVTTY